MEYRLAAYQLDIRSWWLWLLAVPLTPNTFVMG
jgi:hypothetical protein